MDKKEVLKSLKDIKDNVKFIEKKAKRGDIGFVCATVVDKIDKLEEEIMG